MKLFTRRVAWAYAILLVCAALFLLRRAVLPTVFELEGVPFDIAVGSALNACYGRPTLSSCSDLGIVALAVIGVVVATWWGSAGRTAFAVILALLPLGLYLVLSPIWIPLIMLLLIPPTIGGVAGALFPAQA